MKDQHPEFYGKKKTGQLNHDFLSKYDNLKANTNFKQDFKSTSTICAENTSFKKLRSLQNSGQAIIGLDEKVKRNVNYVEGIGKIHLMDNEYYKNNKYNAFDVFNFDINKFSHQLANPDLEEQTAQVER